MAFCYECGTKLNDNAKFCHGCGIKIEIPAYADEKPTVEEKKAKISYTEEKVEEPKSEEPKKNKVSKYKEVTKEQVSQPKNNLAEELKKSVPTPPPVEEEDDDDEDDYEDDNIEVDDDEDEDNKVALLPEDEEDDEDDEDEDDYEDEDEDDEENLQPVSYDYNASNPETDPYWNDLIPEAEEELSKIPKELFFKGIGAVVALLAVIAWLVYMLA